MDAFNEIQVKSIDPPHLILIKACQLNKCFHFVKGDFTAVSHPGTFQVLCTKTSYFSATWWTEIHIITSRHIYESLERNRFNYPGSS